MALLLAILPRSHGIDNVAVPYGDRIEKIDEVLVDIGLALGLVPFELHVGMLA